MLLTSGEEVDDWDNAGYSLIMALRKMFADISLEMLKPDLVIMDEFQKFSSLIVTNHDDSQDSEEIVTQQLRSLSQTTSVSSRLTAYWRCR